MGTARNPDPDVVPDAVLDKAVSSSKWMLYLSGSALIAGYGTNVLLARLGAETLGLYGLLLLQVSHITAFFVLGGANVLVNFFPGIADGKKRAFLGSYALLLVGFSAFSLGLFLVIPGLDELVFGGSLDVPVVTYMTILVPVLLLQFLVWGILQAGLRFKALAISLNCVSWLYFVLLVGVVAFGVMGARSAGVTGKSLLAVAVTANAAALYD